MKFNETNTVEAYVIAQLAGEKISSGSIFQEPIVPYQKPWLYVAPQDLKRTPNEVLLENNLNLALQRLNPAIAKNPALADEVIYKLRAILLSVNQNWFGPCQSGISQMDVRRRVHAVW